MTARPDAYEVEWSTGALRALDVLPEKVATAVAEFVYSSLAADPRRVGRALRFELDGYHSARRGDYRIVYRINERRHAVTFSAVAHRADVYRRR